MVARDYSEICEIVLPLQNPLKPRKLLHLRNLISWNKINSSLFRQLLSLKMLVVTCTANGESFNGYRYWQIIYCISHGWRQWGFLSRLQKQSSKSTSFLPIRPAATGLTAAQGVWWPAFPPLSVISFMPLNHHNLSELSQSYMQIPHIYYR